jgi:hypothetical protein
MPTSDTSDAAALSPSVFPSPRPPAGPSTLPRAPRTVLPLALPPALARAGLAAAALLLGGLVFGLVRFVRESGIPTVVLPRHDRPPAEEHNLASLRLGPTVRVSSYHRDPISQHHPLFLVDGRTAPTLLEKWVSAGPDRQPWVELTWREPRALARVVIRHAGEYEGKELTLAHYKLVCLRPGGPGPTLEVTDNRAGLAVHELSCSGAHGVRLEAHPSGKDLVRIYEIEAWGR